METARGLLQKDRDELSQVSSTSSAKHNEIEKLEQTLGKLAGKPLDDLSETVDLIQAEINHLLKQQTTQQQIDKQIIQMKYQLSKLADELSELQAKTNSNKPPLHRGRSA